MSKRKKREDSGGPSWLTTYSDLVTLLLCFFVLLYSFAIVDKEKFQQAALSLRAAFGNSGVLTQNSGDTIISLTPYQQGDSIFDLHDEVVGNETEDTETGKDEGDAQTDEGNGGGSGDGAQTGGYVSRIQQDIQGLINELGLNENIKVIEEKSMIILRMDSVILFDMGKADIKPSARDVIRRIGEILKDIDTDIMVQGHADDRPINTPEFPSNWELSTKRATNVVKFLINECGIDPKNLTATGNAEFRPIVPNDSEYNRQKNRRIDIAILK